MQPNMSFLPPLFRLYSGVPIFVEHWGDNFQFYPNFALFLTLGDEPRPRFCLGEQIK